MQMDKMDKKEIKEGQSIILTVMDTFPAIEEIYTDNNNEEISLCFHGKEDYYNFSDIIMNKNEIYYTVQHHNKNSIKMNLIKNNSLFATGSFQLKIGEQWVTFSYENKKKSNSISLALSLINCIKLKFSCKIDPNPNNNNIKSINEDYNLNENKAANSPFKQSPQKNNNSEHPIIELNNEIASVSKMAEHLSQNKTPKANNLKNSNDKSNSMYCQNSNINNSNDDIVLFMSTNNIGKNQNNVITPNNIKNNNQKSKNTVPQSELKKNNYDRQPTNKGTKSSFDNSDKTKGDSVNSLVNNVVYSTLEATNDKNKQQNIKRKKSKNTIEKNKVNNKKETQPKETSLNNIISDNNKNIENNNENNKEKLNRSSNIIHSKNVSNANSDNNLINNISNNNYEEEEKKEFDDSDLLNLNLDNYSRKLNDFHLLYNDEYFKKVNEEDLALEIDFYIEKFFELVSEYHIQVQEKILEHQLMESIFFKNVSLYKEIKKIIKKFEIVRDNIELKNTNLKLINGDYFANNSKNLNTNNEEIKFFKFLAFSESDKKTKQNKEKLKKIVKILLNKEHNKNIVIHKEKYAAWINANIDKSSKGTNKKTGKKNCNTAKGGNNSSNTNSNNNNKNDRKRRADTTNNNVKSRGKHLKNANNDENKRK